MISIRKLIANWRNARKSPGPRTPGGKRISSANSTTHGLFAKNTPVFPGEETALAAFSLKIHEDIQPQGPTESYYTDRFIDQCWRLHYCLKLETDLFEWYRVYKNTKGSVGVAFAHDADQLNCFGRLGRYSRQFERAMGKDLAELAKLQARRCRPPVEPRPLATQEPGPVLVASTGTNSDIVGPPLAAEPQSPAVAPSSAAAPVPPLPGLGIFTAKVVLSDEDPAQFRSYCEGLFAEWRPPTVVKACFVELFGVNSWRLARLSRVEAGLYEQYRFHENIDGGLLTAFAQDANELDCFAKLAQYETQMRSSLSRILKVLLADG